MRSPSATGESDAKGGTPLSRREILRGSLLLGGALFASRLRAGEAQRVDDPPSLAPFDRAMEEHMRAREIPGGALAVLRRGQLVHARGYGLLDRDGAARVSATSLFRIASVSKPITAIAILRLVEAERLALDEKLLRHIDGEPHLAPGAELDPRWEHVTIRHALEHSGGWDRDKSFDPMFRAVPFARELGLEPPAQARDVIRVMRGKPLDFDPGTRYAYSNFGYCLLGRVIEAIAGTSYEVAVRELVLAPIGVRSMRIGSSRKEGRAEGEVRYHVAKARDAERTDSVFAGATERVAAPDGGFCVEAMDAHGGWIASAVDLARVLAALDAPADPPLLRAGSIDAMFARPRAPLWRRADGTPEVPYYGLGWMVREIEGEKQRINTWHTGSLPGTSTLMVRRHDGLAWIALFNLRHEGPEPPDGGIDAALHRAAGAVEPWPEHDLFERF